MRILWALWLLGMAGAAWGSDALELRLLYASQVTGAIDPCG
ncbi:MAG: hypothetical protein Kow0092_12870 [Deferrisomatales bacterium]